jgi:hypothetical protein
MLGKQRGDKGVLQHFRRLNEKDFAHRRVICASLLDKVATSSYIKVHA